MKWKKAFGMQYPYIFPLLVVGCLCTLTFYYVYQGQPVLHGIPPLPRAHENDALRRHLALRLETALRIYLADPEGISNNRLVPILESVMRDLDPRVESIRRPLTTPVTPQDLTEVTPTKQTKVVEGQALSTTDAPSEADLQQVRNSDGLDEGQQVPKTQKKTKKAKGEMTVTRHVCPEVHNHTTKSWKRPNCRGMPPFDEVVTMVLLALNLEVEDLSLLIQRIRKVHSTAIQVITWKSDSSPLKHERVNVTSLDDALTLDAAINGVVQGITTPYTFVGINLTHFTKSSNLMRLVETLDTLFYVDVASGAIRDLTGMWSHGCLQLSLKNYQAVFTPGYQYSKEGCMFCDHAPGPFLARTSTLKKVKFSPRFDEVMLLRDWFTKLMTMGHVTTICPDVMFFVHNNRPTWDDWLAYATRWSLQRIITEDLNQYDFKCNEVNIICSNLLRTVESYLLPPCCLDKIMQALGRLQDCTEKLNIVFELNLGSLLGAVKMGGAIPWDFEHDLRTDCPEKSKWFGQKLSKCLRSNGCKNPKSVEPTYWVINCLGVSIDIVCRYNLSKDLPEDYRNTPTTIMYNSRPTRVYPNPGKTSRDVYGAGYLQHEIHWRYMESENGQGEPGEGSWKACRRPYHHACQNHFPSDGNIAFKQHQVC